MIGFYDYTVVLTYLSLISASAGILVSLSDNGHPYIGTIFLLISGLCDAFDGQVARTKKNRTDMEKNYGVQIDSLADVVAFGVLPVCIGMAIMKSEIALGIDSVLSYVPRVIIVLLSAIFVLCALIRLAYFNVTVEETQGAGNKGEKFYFGLPVTSSALIFPTFMLLRFFVPLDISFLYYILLFTVALLFIIKFRLKKPTIKGVCMMVVFGAIEFIVVLAIMIWMKRG